MRDLLTFEAYSKEYKGRALFRSGMHDGRPAVHHLAGVSIDEVTRFWDWMFSTLR